MSEHSPAAVMAVMADKSGTCGILALPDEIMLTILQNLNISDVLNLGLTSRKFNNLVDDPLLWKHFSFTRFRYWTSRFVHSEGRAHLGFMNWKSVMHHRFNVNDHISQLFDEINRTKQYRNYNIARICTYNLEAKDFLLEQCRLPQDHPEALCRKWFANRIINALHRHIAMNQWWKCFTDSHSIEYEFRHGYKKKRLERIIGSFAMFFFQQDEGDFEAISCMFDNLADQFCQQHPGCMHQPIHDRALALLHWVNKLSDVNRQAQLAILPDPAQARRLDITRKLLDCLQLPKDEDMRPHVQAVFIALAQRLKVPAYLCNYSRHLTLVAVPRTHAELEYLIPPHQGEAKPLAFRPGILDEAIPLDFPFRPAMEIELANTFRQSFVPELLPEDPADLRSFSYMTPSKSPYEMYRTALYMDICFGVLHLAATKQSFDTIKDRFIDEMYLFPEDIWVLLPRLTRKSWVADTAQPEFEDQTFEELNMLMQRDASPPRPRNRQALRGDGLLPFRIGDVVWHDELELTAVVAGWGPDEHDDTMGDGLSHHQRFLYLALSFPWHDARPMDADDEVDLVPVTDPDWVAAMPGFHAAGQYFKRFDRASCRFVSNIREEFPED